MSNINLNMQLRMGGLRFALQDENDDDSTFLGMNYSEYLKWASLNFFGPSAIESIKQRKTQKLSSRNPSHGLFRGEARRLNSKSGSEKMLVALFRAAAGPLKTCRSPIRCLVLEKADIQQLFCLLYRNSKNVWSFNRNTCSLCC